MPSSTGSPPPLSLLDRAASLSLDSLEQDYENPQDGSFKPISPHVVAIAREIGDDSLIAERVLSYVRDLKKKVLAAQLRALYSDEEIQAMIEKASQQDTGKS